MATKIKLGTDGNWAVKENNLLAYNDENNVFKAIELQSSRASGATYVGEDGLIKDAEVGVPRIDWTNGVGELLLEPLRRNKITDSSFLNVTDVAPYKVKTTSTLVSDLGFGAVDFFTNDTTRPFEIFSVAVNADTYVASVYIEDITNLNNINVLQFIDVATVSTSSKEWSIDGGKTWDSVASNLIPTSSGIRICLRVTFLVSGTAQFRIGLGCNNPIFETSVTMSAPQIEDDGTNGVTYPTSFIPTTTAQATRIADAVTGNSSLGQVINSSEGVLYFEGSALANDGNFRAIQLKGNNGNKLNLGFSNTLNEVYYYKEVGGVVHVPTIASAATDVLSVNKIALKYTPTENNLWINGVEAASSTGVGAFPVSLSELNLKADGTIFFYGRIRELKVYDTALTDAQLQVLTR